MILRIEYKSGDREFTLDAYHMEPPADSIAPMLAHIAEILVTQDADAVWHMIPRVPEIAKSA